MKLIAQAVSYSSVVGGGILLMTEKGHVAFQIALIGSTAGISKEQSKAMAARLVELINQHGLEVPER
ncbi:DUF2783 domain-containing protein [Rhizobium sp. SSA_523]|uniref:DUF2783 domain-containing protein n=1 Tax=Rhizobium sp. SSA_523 TaxID=2952477 RepID=UPI002091B7B5|nr:DUF2783 domain-containing protein [Rhizobium sp. SSA_523]MCO5730151.1 DUF2783 domain-containing protein [Rhizobium sp. SSA_523]WKC25216.1 DUF2783 domain-containing protein [Rhizobium sp. SSA_523]